MKIYNFINKAKDIKTEYKYYVSGKVVINKEVKSKNKWITQEEVIISLNELEQLSEIYQANQDKKTKWQKIKEALN